MVNFHIFRTKVVVESLCLKVVEHNNDTGTNTD